MEFPNTTITINRGTEANDYGDTSDVGIATYTKVPALLIETTVRAYDPSTQTPRTAHQALCVLPSWQDVLDTDTVLDETTGFAYMVESVVRQQNYGYPTELVVQLTRISATGI